MIRAIMPRQTRKAPAGSRLAEWNTLTVVPNYRGAGGIPNNGRQNRFCRNGRCRDRNKRLGAALLRPK